MLYNIAINHFRGFVGPLVLIIIASLLIGGGYWYTQKSHEIRQSPEPKEVNQNSIQSIQAATSTKDAEEKITVDTQRWSVYSDLQKGFLFSYSPEEKVLFSSSSAIVPSVADGRAIYILINKDWQRGVNCRPDTEKDCEILTSTTGQPIVLRHSSDGLDQAHLQLPQGGSLFLWISCDSYTSGYCSISNERRALFAEVLSTLVITETSDVSMAERSLYRNSNYGFSLTKLDSEMISFSDDPFSVNTVGEEKILIKIYPGSDIGLCTSGEGKTCRNIKAATGENVVMQYLPQGYLTARALFPGGRVIQFTLTCDSLVEDASGQKGYCAITNKRSDAFEKALATLTIYPSP